MTAITATMPEQLGNAQEGSNMGIETQLRRDTRQRIKELEVAAQSPEIAWIRQQMKIIRSGAWSTAHAQIAAGFLTSNVNGRLFAYQDENARLQLSTTFPNGWTEVLVLLKDPSVSVSMANIKKTIQCQLLRKDPCDSLLRVLQSIYVPFLFDNEGAQVSVTKDFEEDYFRFMATLTESINEARGKTLLYLPPLQYQGTIKDQSQNKELTQRLEQVVIRWTRQIKDVIRIKDQGENEETGPLAEINFWHQRNENLSGILGQIQHPNVNKNISILKMFRSSYVDPFLELALEIEKEAIVAEDNLKYLITLEKPCQMLASCSIRDIPNCYSDILCCIRMIWKLSLFYNTAAKITNLLCLVSNAIIKRCSSGIPLQEIFDGDEEICRVALKESVHANEAWKRLYSTMVDTAATLRFSSNNSSPKAMDVDAKYHNAATHNKKNTIKDKRKVSDWNSKIIFAPVEAFLQRCQDMLEVCDAQSQFSGKMRRPSFAGAQGLEVSKSLLDAQENFKRLSSQLNSLSYNLLDVKVTRWHNDFHKFKAGVTDLEIMVQNVMTMAFKNATSLSESIELLEAFKLMACRTSICTCVEKMTSTVFVAFMGELTVMKRQFDLLRRRPLMDYSFPRFAGGAIWAFHFQHRLLKPMELLVHATPYLLENQNGPNLSAQYDLIAAGIDQYVQSQYVEWTESLDSYLEKKLQITLLEDIINDVIQLHFDANVLAVFKEVHYWSALGFKIPWIALNFITQHQNYMSTMNDVFRMACDYNKLLRNMDLIMRGLVTDCVIQVNNSMQLGIHELTWLSSHSTVHDFLQIAHINCLVVESTITHIEGSCIRISKICHDISASYLISLEKKKIYEISEFEDIQIKHRSTMREKYERAYFSLKENLATSYEKCSSDLEEVQIAWDGYRGRIEVEMENALRKSVVQSLSQIAKVVSPEAKTLNPLFKTMSLLQKSSNHVKISPSLQEFTDMVYRVAKDLVTVTMVVPRLQESRLSALTMFVQGVKDKSSLSLGKEKTTSLSLGFGNKKPVALASSTSSSHTNKSTLISNSTPSSSVKTQPSFYEIIAPQQENVTNTIISSLMSINDKVQIFLSSWEKKFKSIWDQDKDAFIRRYERAKKPLSSFDSDIIKYKDFIEDVQAEETITNLRFIKIENGILKHTIVEHCEAWILKFETLLHQIAKTELYAIYHYFKKFVQYWFLFLPSTWFLFLPSTDILMMCFIMKFQNLNELLQLAHTLVVGTENAFSW